MADVDRSSDQEALRERVRVALNALGREIGLPPIQRQAKLRLSLDAEGAGAFQAAMRENLQKATEAFSAFDASIAKARQGLREQEDVSDTLRAILQELRLARADRKAL